MLIIGWILLVLGFGLLFAGWHLAVGLAAGGGACLGVGYVLSKRSNPK